MIQWNRIRIPAREVRVGNELEVYQGFRPVKRIEPYGDHESLAFTIEDCPFKIIYSPAKELVVDVRSGFTPSNV